MCVNDLPRVVAKRQTECTATYVIKSQQAKQDRISRKKGSNECLQKLPDVDMILRLSVE